VIVTKLSLKNWKNFREVDIHLRERTFIVGSNAAGKSNLLDVFRFLRDIAKPVNGGLQSAVNGVRGGLANIRCVNARNPSRIEIDVELGLSDKKPQWRYQLSLDRERGGKNRVLVSHEKVWNESGKVLLDRPNSKELDDKEKMTVTHLESATTNSEFRDISDFFQQVSYLHLVPQLLRSVESTKTDSEGEDYYGRNFLVRIAKTPERVRKSRLKRLEEALQIAVPQFSQIEDTKDEAGMPHLKARLRHWCESGKWMNEEHFSDGTIRLIGLCWALMESDSLMLLEEPELSLNDRIVSQLPALFWKLQASKGRQVLLSTHSYSLLSDQGIQPEEVVILIPGEEGTTVSSAADHKDVLALIEGGMSMGQAILPLTDPQNVTALTL
jgi:predicted ATPase